MTCIKGGYYDPSVKYPPLYHLHSGFGKYIDWQRKKAIGLFAENTNWQK